MRRKKAAPAGAAAKELRVRGPGGGAWAGPPDQSLTRVIVPPGRRVPAANGKSRSESCEERASDPKKKPPGKAALMRHDCSRGASLVGSHLAKLGAENRACLFASGHIHWI